MSRIFEALARAEAAVQSERRQTPRQAVVRQIRLFGYDSEGKPYYGEGETLNVSASGALLSLQLPASEGATLFLINSATGKLSECRIVRTRCSSGFSLEVAVAFVAPDPEFWERRPESHVARSAEKRRHPRITLPRGMVVIWQGDGARSTSRVQTLSTGGLSMWTPEPPPIGESVNLYIELPGGGVCARGIVRHAQDGNITGLEFVAIRADARARLNYLLSKLLMEPGKP